MDTYWAWNNTENSYGKEDADNIPTTPRPGETGAQLQTEQEVFQTLYPQSHRQLETGYVANRETEHQGTIQKAD